MISRNLVAVNQQGKLVQEDLLFWKKNNLVHLAGSDQVTLISP